MSTLQPGKPPAAAAAAAPPLQKPPGYRDPGIPTQYRPPPPAAPRKPINLPPSFYESKRRRSCRRTFCCCICASVGILLIILLAASGLFYLWFQPRLPEIHLRSTTFTKFNVTTTVDGPVLDSEYTIGVEIKNPNQNLKIEYDKTRISLSAIDGNVDFGQQILPGFTQGKHNVTNLKYSIKVPKEILDNESANQLKNGYRSKNLLLNGELGTRIGVKGNGWGTGTVQVKVICNGMRLKQLQGGGNGATPKCNIRILNWIPIN